jgi:hypothetical protein
VAPAGQARSQGSTAAKTPSKVVSRPAPLPLSIPRPRVGAKSAPAKPALTAREALALKAKAHAAKSKPLPKAVDAAEAPAPAQAPTFDPAVVNADAAHSVKTLVEHGEHAALLVDAWLAANNAAAIAETAESGEVPTSARKAARRALNILRSRGVAIPTHAHVVKIDDRVEVSVEASFQPPDSNGTFSLTIASRDTAGRYHVAEVLIREPLGITHAGSGWLSGSQLKEIRARAMESTGVAPAPVPVEWARYRIAEARKLNPKSGQVLPLALDRCGELLEPVPEVAPPHPLADLEAEITSESAARALVGSEALHFEPELRALFPDHRAVDDLFAKLGERVGATGQMQGPAMAAMLHEEVEAATDRFFSPDVRATLAVRMRDLALSVRARKGDKLASTVLSVARAVREAGLITAPPREIPFLIAFFDKAIGAMAQQSGGQIRVPVPDRARPQRSEPSLAPEARSLAPTMPVEGPEPSLIEPPGEPASAPETSSADNVPAETVPV